MHRKEVARSYRTLFMELGFVVSIADPIKSITKIASKIGVKEKTIRKAVQILDAAQDAGIAAGKNPEIVAASRNLCGMCNYWRSKITNRNRSSCQYQHSFNQKQNFGI